MHTLYERFIAADIPIDHHYSDLYVPATPEARAVIHTWEAETGHRAYVEIFTRQTDRTLWLDLPFAYDPYWTRHAAAR